LREELAQRFQYRTLVEMLSVLCRTYTLLAALPALLMQPPNVLILLAVSAAIVVLVQGRCETQNRCKTP